VKERKIDINKEPLESWEIQDWIQWSEGNVD
jgi:hypothetical protein